MPTHNRARPNIRNLIARPLWMTLKIGLRTIPFFGKYFQTGKVGEVYQPADDATRDILEHGDHPSTDHMYTADRSSTDVAPSINKPATILYPYERLEEIEPWLFVPGQYNGRIGVIWETCTACKACVRICPNDCLHMTTEYRVDVLDNVEGEWEGFGSDIEMDGFVARPIAGVAEAQSERVSGLHHNAPEEEWEYGRVVDLSQENARISWVNTEMEEAVPISDLYRAEQEIVSGRIDMGRCMFCGLCMESCNFTSFFMTNEYDGMSGFTREDLWFDADRTRVLPHEHQEAVDGELAKRASRERTKRERAAAKAEA